MIKNIQALRATAALMVIFVHLDGLLTCVGLPGFGTGGVDLFFVISGFIMVHTTRLNPPTATAFMRNRIARIAPLYWIMTIAVYLVATIYPTWLKSTTTDPLALIKSLLFIPFRKSNGLVHPVLFVAWTLNYEMFFYLILTLGLGFRRFESGFKFTLTILGSLSAIGFVLSPREVIGAFYTNSVILEFGLGMSIARLIDYLPTRAGKLQKFLAIASLLCLPILVFLPLVLPYYPRVITAGIPSTGLVMGAVVLERWGWQVRGRLALAVGEASYALYLSHPYVVIPFQSLALRVHPGAVSATVLICIGLGLTVSVGYTLHRIVERPLSRYARSLLLTGRLQSVGGVTHRNRALFNFE